MLQMLAAEKSNHEYMLRKHDVSSYVEQLVYLASPQQKHGHTVAAALRGLRLLAEFEEVRAHLIPPLMPRGMPSSPHFPWCHVACPPHPTSLDATWQVDGVLRTLTSQMKLIPVLLHAALSAHEDTMIEVSRP